MPGPPVARMVATPGWFISAPVASMDGVSIHWMQFSGAPAFTAASYTMRAASAEHFCADGWKPKMMGLRVFTAIRLLNSVVEVGLVVGITAAITPRGSAIFT